MSFFFGDGFDLYAQPQDAAAGYWDASPNFSSCNLQPGRFSGSRAMNMGGNPAGVKTSGQNDAVHHFTFAYMQTSNTTSANTGFFITLWDGATAQCTVDIRGDGGIELRSGGYTGTVLASWFGPALVANVWYAFEFEVVVHNTSGYLIIRKNGNANNDYYSGVFNTRNSANNYANKMSFGYAANIGASIYIDDFLWRSEPSTVPWSGDIRCYTRRPASDVGTPQWSRTSAPVNSVMWSPVGVQQQFQANWATYMMFQATYSGLLTGVILGPNSNGGTGHIKAALFSNLNGAVGSVLAVTSELTNPAAGGMTLSFPTPYFVTAGQTYWMGVVNDSGTVATNVGGTALDTWYSTAIPYASWPVSNPVRLPQQNNVIGLTLIITPTTNADAVGELYQDLAVNYVYSSTNGQNDLYNIGSIPGTPAQVLGVVTRGFFEKSDSGTRNATVQLKSGGTTVQGPDTALVTATWNWILRTDLTDPATGAAWTATAVNSVQIGPRCTA